MRVLVAGVNSDGKSCAVRDSDAKFQEVAPGLAASGIFATSENPPVPRPPGRGELVDLGVAPGRSSWVLWRFAAGSDYPMHHTDTVDFDVITHGSVALILDDGVHELRTGDCVVVQGVDHAWRAGPDGCIISGVAIGSATPS